MGTLTEKLEYLAETKEEIKKALIARNVEVSEDDTFRDYAQKIKDAPPSQAYLKYMNGKSVVEDFENENFSSDGTYKIGYCRGHQYKSTVGASWAIAPEMDAVQWFPLKLSEGRRQSFSYIPHATRNWNPTPSKIEDAPVWDMSRIHYDYAAEKELYGTHDLCMPHSYNYSGSYAPTFLGLPNIFNFVNSNIFINVNMSKFPYIFEQGLSLGTECVCTSQSFGNSMLAHAEKPVFVQNGFKTSLYLPQVPMSAETIVGIFENLATTTSATISIGTTNLEKLTDEQLQIAYDKGWDVT